MKLVNYLLMGCGLLQVVWFPPSIKLTSPFQRWHNIGLYFVIIKILLCQLSIRLFRIISIPSKFCYFRLPDHVISMECLALNFRCQCTQQKLQWWFKCQVFGVKYEACKLLTDGLWFTSSSLISSINKTDHRNIQKYCLKWCYTPITLSC
jgi:hypothetical protein